VVFAEDVTDVQSTDVVSGESICFCQRVGGYAKLVIKPLGRNCALIIISILTERASNNYTTTLARTPCVRYEHSFIQSWTRTLHWHLSLRTSTSHCTSAFHSRTEFTLLKYKS
jgi:hypothetical protein